jgi:hypothetical protein
MKNDTHANDNEELSFITLAALTANVTRWLIKPDEKKDTEHHDNGNGAEEKSEEGDKRLADFARGKRNSRLR